MRRPTLLKTLTPTQTRRQAVLLETLAMLMAGRGALRLPSFEEVCLARSMIVWESQR